MGNCRIWNDFASEGYKETDVSIERSDAMMRKASSVYHYNICILGFGRPVRRVDAEVTYELPNGRYVIVNFNALDEDRVKDIELLFERTYETLLRSSNILPDIAAGTASDIG